MTSAELKTCPYCAETIKTAAIRCRYCHADLTRLPADIELPRVERPDLVDSEAVGVFVWPDLVTSAAVGSFVCAAYTMIVVAIQVFAGYAGLAAWNLLIGAVDIIIGVGILKRRETARSWGIGTNGLNAFIQVVGLAVGGWHMFALLIPVELLIVGCLLAARGSFRGPYADEEVQLSNARGLTWEQMAAEIDDPSQAPQS